MVTVQRNNTKQHNVRNNKPPMTTYLALSVVVSMAMLSGCGKQSDYSHSYSEHAAPASAESYDAKLGNMAEYAPETKSSAVSEQDKLTSQAASDKNQYTAEGKKRQLLKQADAKFSVKDVYKISLALEDLALKYGGFVTQNSIENRLDSSYETRQYSQQQQQFVKKVVEKYVPEARLSLRIPQHNLQAFLRNMVAHSEFLFGRSFSAQDVMLDIYRQQQLAKINANASSQVQRAPKTKDELYDKVAAVNSQVAFEQSKLLSEIEKANIKDKVAFSEVNLWLVQSPILHQYEEVDFQQAIETLQPSFTEKATASLQQGWQVFLSFFIGLVGMLPFIVFFAVVFTVFRKLWRWLAHAKTAGKNNKIQDNYKATTNSNKHVEK